MSSFCEVSSEIVTDPIVETMENLNLSSKSKKKKDVPKLQDCFKNMYTILDAAKPVLKKLEIEGVKDAHKTFLCELKMLERHSSANQTSRKIKHGVSRVTGFTKPMLLLPPVSAFFNCVPELSRSNITKLVNSYIDKNALQVPDKKQTFFLDENLARLFGGEPHDVDSYRLFTRRIKYAFPITPQAPTLKTFENEPEHYESADTVLVFAYDASILTKPSDGSLFEEQIALNRSLATFSSVVNYFKAAKTVSCFKVPASSWSYVFLGRANGAFLRMDPKNFTLDWVNEQLGTSIKATN
jgi:chromatin remodeling complex protein RSC6